MKRKLIDLAAALLVLMPAALQAQVTARHFHTWPPVSVTGPTTYLDLRSDTFNSGTLMARHQTADVTLGTGSNSICTWQLEGSNDLVTWYSLSGSQDCTAANMIHVLDRPTAYVRINVLTYTGAASLTFNWAGL